MQTFSLVPQRVTQTILNDLEAQGLITRICPTHDVLQTPSNESRCKRIYENDAQYGGHMLLSVTTDCTTFSNFGYHPGREDVLLIGVPSKPLYLLLCYLSKAAFLEKAESASFIENDFLLLELVFNDPNLSFFTLHENVLHGEATVAGVGDKPSFYVGESSSMGLQHIPLEKHLVIILGNE